MAVAKGRMFSHERCTALEKFLARAIFAVVDTIRSSPAVDLLIAREQGTMASSMAY